MSKDVVNRKNDSSQEGQPDLKKRFALKGDHQKIRVANERAFCVAKFPARVFLQGASGTGKSMLARYIHYNGQTEYKSVCKEVWEGIQGVKLKEMLAWAAGFHKLEGGKEIADVKGFEKELGKAENKTGRPLKNQQFREINLAALNEITISAELFGYVGGAYTDSYENGMPGLFINANGGTLFLDEIADCPLSIQAKLLAVIQQRKDEDGDCACYVIPNGQEEEVRVNVRLICATNKDLHKEVRAGRFREDLYYRSKEYEIRLPSFYDDGPDHNDLVDPYLKEDVFDYGNLTYDDNDKGDKWSSWSQKKKIDFLRSLYENHIVTSDGERSDIFDDMLKWTADSDLWESDIVLRRVVSSVFERWQIFRYICDELDKINKKLLGAQPNLNPTYIDKKLTDVALRKMLEYGFPGNYRELQRSLMQACLNARTRFILMSKSETRPNGKDDVLIILKDLPDEIQNYSPDDLSNIVDKCIEESFSDEGDSEKAKALLDEMVKIKLCTSADLAALCAIPGFRFSAPVTSKKISKNKEANQEGKRGFAPDKIRDLCYFIHLVKMGKAESLAQCAPVLLGRSSGPLKDFFRGFGVDFEEAKNAILQVYGVES